MPDEPDHPSLPAMEIQESPDDAGGRASKIGGPLAAQLPEVGDDEALTGVVKVTEPGYVPEGVARRATISPTLFTADLSRRRLEELEHDPRVVSVELSRRLGTTET
jgi:hypothetical protein